MIEAISIPGYRTVRELGRGAMATVYLAIQEKFEREVALKVMSPLLDRDPSFAIRFEREARIVAQMSHSSIVHVIDVDHHEGYHYLVMECLPGGDLKARIKAGEHGLALALKVCVAIASALDSAHSRKIVHRDVKPANILFRQDGTPVLTDFGIARPMDTSSQLTMVGTLIGTLDYMSPEQANGKDLDGRSDLYSLGAVFYEVLTGTVPYPADSTASMLMKQANDPPPLLPAQFAMFQPFLDQIMAKERDHRYATGGEVIRVLRMVTEVANARRADVTLQSTLSAHAAAEYPTVVAPRAAPGSAVGSETIASVRFPATETRPSGVMPIPSEALAMVTATEGTGRIDPAAMPDAEPSEAAALTLISVRPPSPTVAPASPAPGTSQAPASPAQNSQVRSVAAQFVRAPMRAAIAAGICVAAIGVYLLVATGDGASERADVSAGRAQTPIGQPSPLQQLGEDAPPENPTLRVSDTAASTPLEGATEQPVGPKEQPEKRQRPPSGGAQEPERPAGTPKPNQKTAVGSSKAETQKLADEQAKRNLEVERRQKEAEILPLLIEAKRYTALGHLWRPQGNSAADRYLAVEKIDSNNAAARDGLARIFDAIIQEARNEAATGDRVATNALIQRLRVLRPDHSELPNLEAQLDKLATEGPKVNSVSKAKQQRAEGYIKSANSKLDNVPLTHALLESAWKEFRRAETAAPSAPGLLQLRARFPESLAIAVKIEFDRGDTTRLRRLIELAKSNGWQYSDPTQADKTASDQ
jgi:tRNA A-37 threonylcarbamoyl transferase component Bud32